MEHENKINSKEHETKYYGRRCVIGTRTMNQQLNYSSIASVPNTKLFSGPKTVNVNFRLAVTCLVVMNR